MRQYKYNNLELNETLIAEVKLMLGKEFDDLEKFFRDVFFSFESNRATIFITRRCMLLAKFFLEYFVMNDKNDTFDDSENFPAIKSGNCRNYLFTDKTPLSYIISYPVEEIYVVDDICIHGKTLYNLTKDISAQWDNKQLPGSVYSQVYMVSEETLLKSPDKYYKSVSRAGWTELSQRIVNVINLINLPYVSYLHTWTKKVVAPIEFKEMRDLLYAQGERLEVIPYSLSQYDHKQCYYIYEKTISEGTDISCLRLYYNDLTNTVSFVPFVALLSCESAVGNKAGMQSDFETNYFPTNKFMENIDKDDPKKKDYMFNLKSCLMSYAYGLYFIEKYLKISRQDLLKDYRQDISGCIRLAFGKEFLNRLNGFDWNFDMYEEQFVKPFENDRSNQIAENIDEDKVRQLVEQVCRENWENMEHESYNYLNEAQPYVNQYLYDILERIISATNCSQTNRYLCKQTAFFNIVKLCDMGRINILTSNNKGTIILRAGELGYVLTKEYLRSRNNSSGQKSQEFLELINSHYYRRLFF